MKKLAVVILAIVAAAAGVWADVPNEITYQGRLREYGQPVTGSRTVNFRIYRTASGPGTVWESGDMSVQVSSGAFACVLKPAVDWREKDFWVETVVSGKTLSPREKLTATAFSLHSRTAEDMAKKAGQDISFTIGTEKVATLTDEGELSSLSGGTTYYMVPRGAIIMWSGATDAIPAGWALCDGTRGTPDLRNRFVVGAGSDYPVGSTGGTSVINATHAHSISSEGNHHTHSYSGTVDVISNTGVAWADSNRTDTGGVLAGKYHQHTFSGTTNDGTTHSHGGATMSYVNANQENRPPYYALAFIMRL